MGCWGTLRDDFAILLMYTLTGYYLDRHRYALGIHCSRGERQEERRTQAGHCQRQARDSSSDGPHRESTCVQRPPSPGSPQERDPLSAAQAQGGSASSASTTDRQQGFSRASPHSHSISKRQQPQYAIPPPAAPDVTHNDGPRGPLPVSLSAPSGGLPVSTAQ